ncbi:MAG TPA: hypothetical protein VJT32_08655 [bacterium]|nr:hypothetical protein [bacterium]
MARPSKETRRYLASLGRKGARSRMTRLTPERRRTIARNAARARWGKKRIERV